MEIMKYLELATSKDQNRENLRYIYRDKQHLVACDGHRLHYTNGLDAIPSGHYLDGQDHGEYPDWHQVLPQESAYTGEIEINFGLPQVKAILAYMKAIGWDDHYCAKLLVNGDEDLVLTCRRSNGDGASVVIGAVSEGDIGTIGVNVKYLVDALAPMKEKYSSAKMEFHGELGPIKITVQHGRQTYNAILMPMRL
jgi:DNA polymerase III sliding clamp (beta) subunit (PCNA family)